MLIKSPQNILLLFLTKLLWTVQHIPVKQIIIPGSVMKQLGYGSGFRFLAGSGFIFWAGSGFNVYGSETLLGGTAWRVPVPDDLDELPHGDMVGDEELGLVEHGQLLFTRKPLYDARDLNMSKGMPKMNNCGSVAVPVPYRYHFDRSGSFTVGAGEQLCGAGADLRSPFLNGSGKKQAPPAPSQ